MEQSNAQSPLQPVPLQTPATHLNALPLIISTVLFILACLISPLAVFAGAFNDMGDPTVKMTTNVILGAALAVTLGHIIVGTLTLKGYRATSKLSASTFWVNIGLFASLVLLFVYLPISTMLPNNQAILLGGMFVGGFISFNLIPALSIASVVLSIIVIVKRKSITR